MIYVDPSEVNATGPGERLPIVVQDGWGEGREVRRTRGVDLVMDGRVVARVLYDPRGGPDRHTRCWIETGLEVVDATGTGFER